VDIPGEPVAALGARWRGLAGPDAEVVSLADGYVGYVETAAHVEAGEGAHALTYYGPELADALERGVKLVTGAVAAAQRPRATGAAAERSEAQPTPAKAEQRERPRPKPGAAAKKADPGGGSAAPASRKRSGGPHPR
jgi:hypothetical protein